MKPHYYLMKGQKILRLEEEMSFISLPKFVQAQRLEDAKNQVLSQSEANWRVALFRDEIMEIDEFLDHLSESQELTQAAQI